MTAALLLIVHGIARAWLGVVDDFGVFLGGDGLPVGTAVAWGVTGFEIIGGTLLTAGRYTRAVALLFCA